MDKISVHLLKDSLENINVTIGLIKLALMLVMFVGVMFIVCVPVHLVR